MCSSVYVYKTTAGQITETVWRRALNHYTMHLMETHEGFEYIGPILTSFFGSQEIKELVLIFFFYLSRFIFLPFCLNPFSVYLLVNFLDGAGSHEEMDTQAAGSRPPLQVRPT